MERNCGNNDICERNGITETRSVALLPILAMCAVLGLFPLVKISLGMDLADTGYSLGNYLYPEKLQDMWYCSTFLANLTGSFLMRLCGGSLLGMRLLTGLIVSAMAIGSFLFCISCFPVTGRRASVSRVSPGPSSESAPGSGPRHGRAFSFSFGTETLPPAVFPAFFGELIAIGLCWCPTVILYNYLTYFFLLSAQMLLYLGLTKNNRILLFFAGACLGLNIMVRLPNVLEAAFILCVIAWGVWSAGPADHSLSSMESAGSTGPADAADIAADQAAGNAARSDHFLSSMESAGSAGPSGAAKPAAGKEVVFREEAKTDPAGGAMRRIIAAALPCILGCLAAYLVLLIVLCITRGPAAYLNMLNGLFSVSQTAEGYSLMDMAGAFIGVFLTESYYLKYIFILCLAGGIGADVLFRTRGQGLKSTAGSGLPGKNTDCFTDDLRLSEDAAARGKRASGEKGIAERTEKITEVDKINGADGVDAERSTNDLCRICAGIYTLASVALFVFLYTRNLFRVSYGDTGAFYNVAALFILLTFMLSAIMTFRAVIPGNRTSDQNASMHSFAGAAHIDPTVTAHSAGEPFFAEAAHPDSGAAQFSDVSSSVGAAHIDSAVTAHPASCASAGSAADAGADSAAQRLMALIVLLTILVLPFGSNNNIYPVINCLFLIAPWTLMQLSRIYIDPKGLHNSNPARSFRSAAGGSVIRILLLPPAVILSACLLAQSLGIGWCYVFGDAPRQELTGIFPEDPALGCVTTPGRAHLLEELHAAVLDRSVPQPTTALQSAAVSQPAQPDSAPQEAEVSQPAQPDSAPQEAEVSQPAEILIYGNLPGLSYYLQLPPAISTTWPNLASYPAAAFVSELETLKRENRKPFVVLGSCEEEAPEKEKALADFLEEMQYSQIMVSEEEGGVKVYASFE